jgi:3-dehydroshikimate dehydratase
MAFGVPGLEHEGFIGSRGGGVNPDPATLQRICPAGSAACQLAPNAGAVPPVLTGVRTEQDPTLTVEGTVRGQPESRYRVEIFGNTQPDSDEGEVFLAEVTVYTDANGRASFRTRLDGSAVTRSVQSLTATTTSPEGATSELSSPIDVRNAEPR